MADSKAVAEEVSEGAGFLPLRSKDNNGVCLAGCSVE